MNETFYLNLMERLDELRAAIDGLRPAIDNLADAIQPELIDELDASEMVTRLWDFAPGEGEPIDSSPIDAADPPPCPICLARLDKCECSDTKVPGQ